MNYKVYMSIIEAFWTTNVKRFKNIAELQSHFDSHVSPLHIIYFHKDIPYRLKIHLIDLNKSWICIRLIIDRTIYNKPTEEPGAWIPIDSNHQNHFALLTKWFEGYSCAVFKNRHSIKIKLFNKDPEQKNAIIVFKYDYPDHTYKDYKHSFEL